jgi:hypothetical protein
MTCSPASRQSACSSDRVLTTLPQVTSYHCASAAKRVGIVRSASSVSGYVSSKIRKQPPGFRARATAANAADFKAGPISCTTRKLVTTS